jgi:hypothetical protein
LFLVEVSDFAFLKDGGDDFHGALNFSLGIPDHE